jgi:hypothetical protein
VRDLIFQKEAIRESLTWHGLHMLINAIKVSHEYMYELLMSHNFDRIAINN